MHNASNSCRKESISDGVYLLYRGPSNGTITTPQGTKTATSAKSSQEIMGHPKLLNNMVSGRGWVEV